MAYLRKITAALAAATLMSVASTVAIAAEDYGDSVSAAPSPEAMAFDLVVVRPLGVAATVIGVGLFVLSLPVDLITWNVKDPAKRLVGDPARYTFARDLGEMQ